MIKLKNNVCIPVTLPLVNEGQWVNGKPIRCDFLEKASFHSMLQVITMARTCS